MQSRLRHVFHSQPSWLIVLRERGAVTLRDSSGSPSSYSEFETRREDYVIFSSVTIAYTGFSASFPFLAVFLIQMRHVPQTEVALLYLASGLLGILGQIAGGKISDLLGTKAITVLGLAVSGAFYGLLAFFVTYNASSYLIMISYPILSLFNNLAQLALSSHISDRPKARMANGMSLLYAGANLGFTIGPVSGGYLAAYLGYSSIFTFGLLTTMASAIVAFVGIKINPKYALRTPIGKTSGKGTVKLTSSLLIFFTLILLSWFAIGFQAIPLAVYETSYLSLSTIKVGIVLSANGLLITLLQVRFSKLIGIERRLRLFPIALGSAIMAVGFVGIGFSSGLTGLLLSIILTTVGEIMVAVPTQVVITLFSREYNRGTYQGYYFAFSRSGIAISSASFPLVFGIFAIHVYSAWILMAVVSVLLALSYQMLSRSLQKDYSEMSDDSHSDPN